MFKISDQKFVFIFPVDVISSMYIDYKYIMSILYESVVTFFTKINFRERYPFQGGEPGQTMGRGRKSLKQLHFSTTRG